MADTRELIKQIRALIDKVEADLDAGIVRNNLRLCDCELSLRVRKILNFEYPQFKTISDLETITEIELSRNPNFGHKSLQELRTLCETNGFKIGSNLG